MRHWKQLTDIAWVGDALLAGPITGIRVVFHGLGYNGMKVADDEDRLHAAQGLLNIFPYYGPWSWMNREARVCIDDLLEETYRTFALRDDVPLLLTGDSMGGGSALLYARYARRPIAAVLANCPACDFTYHFIERPDVARTMYHAFGAYAGEWQEILKEHSPLHQVAYLPDVPYLIIHGDADPAVSKTRHSDPLVAAMRRTGRNVEYHEIPGMGHCGPLPKKGVCGRLHEFLWSKLPQTSAQGGAR